MPVNSHLASTFAVLASLLLLAGCGGGGAGGTPAAAGTGSGTGGAPGAATVTVALSDPVSGAARTSITLGSPALATASVQDANGKAVANTVVSFTSTPAGQVSITPSSGTALTGASGAASVQIDPASLTASGAATVTASAQVGTSTVSGSTSFSIGAATLGLSGLSAGSTALSAYGTRSITVNVTGVPTTTAVAVNFSSLCVSSGKATLPASVQSVNGVAIATYKDNGCGAADTITASIAGTTVTKTVDLVVTPPSIASIQFVSATPATIVLKGTGGATLSESSIVVFKVVDNNSQPIANANVTLDLTTRSGGILLDGTSAGSVIKQTDPGGQVQVAVQAGTVPTPVWVNASTGGFASQSTVLRISTGRPAQDRFSLAVSTRAIEGLQYDGVNTNLTAFASDRLGNPVPDGTAVNIIAEGGQVQPSCATSNGQCSVVFTSANPRPINELPPVGYAGVTNGRVTVLAYALGEESFTDLAPGNNVYDGGEAFNDLGDAYLDNNESGQWDPGESFIPFGAGTSTCVVGIMNTGGVATSPYAPSKAGSCDGRWGQAHVRQQNLIILSGSSAYVNTARPGPSFVPGSTPVDLSFSTRGGCGVTVQLYLFDVNRNPMPAGTVLVTGGLSKAISSAEVGGTPLPDSTATGGTLISVAVRIADSSCPLTADASLDLKITTPKGLTTIHTLTITP